jgi:hypothetical protein
VTTCGRICIGGRKINLSQVFAGQNVGVKEVAEKIWLVTFMHYDLLPERSPELADVHQSTSACVSAFDPRSLLVYDFRSMEWCYADVSTSASVLIDLVLKYIPEFVRDLINIVGSHLSQWSLGVNGVSMINTHAALHRAYACR